MGLSKRERMIVLMTIVVVGGLIGDRLIRAPLMERWGELTGQRRQLLTQVNKAKARLSQKEQVEKKTTLVLHSDAEAESRVGEAIDTWSKDARLTLSSVTPSRMAGDKGLKEIVFVVAGKGSLDAVAWFLYQVESSELPLKVKYMQLGSTSEAGDNMSIELRLSTVYVAAANEKSAPKQRQPRRAETTNEEQLL